MGTDQKQAGAARTPQTAESDKADIANAPDEARMSEIAKRLLTTPPEKKLAAKPQKRSVG